MTPDQHTPSNGSPAQPGPADPLIDEVRRMRRLISEESGGDLRDIAERLRQVEQHRAARVIKPDPAPGARRSA
jgi:hypothetical protein